MTPLCCLPDTCAVLPCPVQIHPGKGVTTVIPVSAASQPRKSAAGNTHALTSSGGSGDAVQELHLALGNRQLMQDMHVAIGQGAAKFMRDHEAQARTCVLVGINGNVVAALAIADPLKPEAHSVVAALQAQVRMMGPGRRGGGRAGRECVGRCDLGKAWQSKCVGRLWLGWVQVGLHARMPGMQNRMGCSRRLQLFRCTAAC